MKAVVIHEARDLRIDEIDEERPGPGQVAVAIRRGGICGSDLHYYQHGGFGAVRLREPMILGHEVAGEIVGAGPGAERFRPGTRVAVSPSRPCGRCAYCQKGLHNHCLDMRFYGSAMPMPHIQGAFRQILVADESQCHAVADGVATEEAAFAEPLAVTLHAVSRAGPLIGRRLLVTGCGPIGSLAIAAARAHGAREIVATDITDFTLGMAKRMGADRTINVAADGDALAEFKAGKGAFDVMIEASGNPAALRAGLECLQPRGILVQLGLGGDVSVPSGLLASREIEWRGSFRFHEEFGLAVDFINTRRIDVRPLLTEVVPLDEAVRAFDLAGDRSRAMKVQIAF